MLCRNILHFRQAEYTPLAGSEIINSIGFGATTKTTDKFMKGTTDIEKLTDDLTSRLLFEIFKTSNRITISKYQNHAEIDDG